MIISSVANIRDFGGSSSTTLVGFLDRTPQHHDIFTEDESIYSPNQPRKLPGRRGPNLNRSGSDEPRFHSDASLPPTIWRQCSQSDRIVRSVFWPIHANIARTCTVAAAQFALVAGDREACSHPGLHHRRYARHGALRYDTSNCFHDSWRTGEPWLASSPPRFTSDSVLRSFNS